MKGKLMTLSIFLLATLIFSVASAHAVPVARLSQTSTNYVNATIDGDLSDWTGTYYVIDDPTDDSIMDATHELNSLWLSVNSTHVIGALNANSSEGTVIYFDTDPGAGTGLTDVNNAFAYGNRPVTFGNGFGAEFWLGGWTYQYWALFNYSSSASVSMPGFSAATNGGILEFAISFQILFGTTTLPANAKLGVLAVAFGGDGVTALDTIPYDRALDGISTTTAVELTNYIVMPLDFDGDGTPDLVDEPTAGWFGGIQDNSAGGNASAGLPLVISMEVWWNVTSSDTMSDHPNMTYAVNMHYTIQDDTGSVITTADQRMYHVAGEKRGNNDVYWGMIDGGQLVEGYRVNVSFTPDNWDPNHSWQKDVVEMSYYVGPAPITGVDYVGGVVPSGGFVAPDTPITIEAQAHWFLNDTGETIHDDPSNTLGVDMTLYYSVNGTESWQSMVMDFSTAFNDNDKYTAIVGPYSANTSLVYYVNATTDTNWMATSNYTIIFGVEPPKTLLFSQTDPSGDEFGTYPTNDAFAPYHGLFDMLQFNVSANDYNVEFAIKMADLSFNDWGGPNGFSHPIFSIYIDNAEGGLTDTIRHEFVTIEDNHAWDYAVIADGWTQLLFSADDPDNAIPGAGVVVHGDAATGIVTITVPTAMIGIPTTDWAYVVMDGSGDFNYYRYHNAEASEWNFGGGTDSEIDPNVVDMFVPAGGNETETQNFLLNNYDVATATLATVYAIGPNISFIEDTTAPTVTINSPDDGATLAANSTGYITVALAYSIVEADQGLLKGLAKVQIYDGNILLEELTIDGLTYDGLLRVTLDAGEHTLKVIAYDVTGNHGIGQVTVTVSAAGGTTETTAPGTSGGGFLPLPVLPGLLALLAIPILRKKR